ncbi:MAG TPA: phospho-N-acetylmuramoyl-pentapeptide-transferase [Blastocatellia bacterium]|jgi:phospho-N-acetylmuramoyl-pentapeptide-transferase|nr:phospho-N-acetylmuramoyl-pentapeptide-transferase [Blastocatellia bacterium]
MFYYLKQLQTIHDSLSFLRLFEQVTFRTAWAAITALVISLMFGPRMITMLRQFQIGQQIREEGPRSHQSKRGTPTMGGVLIILSVAISTLLWSNLSVAYVWIAVGATLAYGAIGFADDYLKIKRRHNLGLTGRQKLALQFAAAIALGISLKYLTAYSTQLSLPFFKNFSPEIWWPMYLLAFAPIVVVGFSNAVNLTDGLDGLAISVTMVTAAALTGFTYVTGHRVFADYLGLAYNSEIHELTIFCAALTGASLGFLWFNAPPAEVFMGDVGSLGIGGAIGTIAVMIKQEFLLVMIGGVFVLEALSVILQVASFKLFKRRIFKMAPLHHHFELLYEVEVSRRMEPKIVFRFLIMAILLALLALSTLKLR